MIDFELNKNYRNGLVFKASVKNVRTSDNGFCFKVALKHLKNKSCSGCENCGWLHDVVQEVNESWPIIGLESCEDGELYTIVPCNESRDFESGIIDSYDLKIREFKE